ncbi:MAG: phosphoribosyl-ATP diphosphatase, partial [Actinobacteria bacterium]|nr:phosphoribosyl-ATP diphosphatase [Actinomycetota bacterium]
MKTIEELFNEVSEKISQKATGSRSYELSNEGLHAIGKKIIEEAGEVWLAAEYQSKEELTEEISQLIYHLIVLMASREIVMSDLYEV